MNAPTRVLLVDDHPLVRRALSTMLGAAEGIEVVAEAACGECAMKALADSLPDVVLLDISLPDVDGITLLERIKQRVKCDVVMLSCHTEERYVRMAMDGGASGYVTKTAEPDEIIAAVRRVREGHVPMSAEIVTGLMSAIRHDPRPNRPDLTSREREVWRLMANGASNSEIAASLFVSEHTVKFHVSNILSKLGFRNRIEAVCAAHRCGLVD